MQLSYAVVETSLVPVRAGRRLMLSDAVVRDAVVG